MTNQDQTEAPEPQSTSPTITKVTLTAGGVQIAIEASGSLAAVAERAQALHREAHERCVRPLPPGHGGML